MICMGFAVLNLLIELRGIPSAMPAAAAATCFAQPPRHRSSSAKPPARPPSADLINFLSGRTAFPTSALALLPKPVTKSVDNSLNKLTQQVIWCLNHQEPSHTSTDRSAFVLLLTSTSPRSASPSASSARGVAHSPAPSVEPADGHLMVYVIVRSFVAEPQKIQL